MSAKTAAGLKRMNAIVIKQGERTMSCEYYINSSYYDGSCCKLCNNRYYEHHYESIIFQRCRDDDSYFYDCTGSPFGSGEKGCRSHLECPIRNFVLSINYDPNKKCRWLKLEYYGYKNFKGTCDMNHCEMSVNGMKTLCMCSGGCADYWNSNPTNTGDGICYISTACVVAKGLPDDCDELQTLRAFRDKMVKEDEAIAEIVKEYYKNAPAIVEKINQEKNSEEIYNFLYDNLVLACVTKLKENKIQDAVNIYTSIYQDLKKKYL